jgi:microcystin-dependent protein
LSASITGINASITGINTNLSNNYYNRNTIKNMLNNSVPIGTIIPFAGTGLPSGFLRCNGASYLRNAYDKLFAAIGTTYGLGTSTNSTTFNVPDIANRTIVGGATGDTARAIGSKTGAETATLTIPNLPAHSHTGTAIGNGSHTHPSSTADLNGVHSHAGSTAISNGEHNHPGSRTDNGDRSNYPGKIDWIGASLGYSDGVSLNPHLPNSLHTHGLNIQKDGNHTHNLNIALDGYHTHDLTIQSDGEHTHNLTINNTGSGTSFSIMNPYITIFYIIKFDDPSNVTEPTIVTENYIPIPRTSRENYIPKRTSRENYKSRNSNVSSQFFGVF